MHSASLTYPRFFRFVLTLSGLIALGLAPAHRAVAQDLVFTLSGCTFTDGAVATGYFDYNPADQTMGTFDVLTTDGIGDGLVGQHYFGAFSHAYPFVGSFIFTALVAPDSVVYNYLLIDPVSSTIDAPGLYPLYPGTEPGLNSFTGSGELAPVNTVARGLTAGSVIVTDANPAPEASTTVSLGLLMALGLGGIVVAARRKKADGGA